MNKIVETLWMVDGRDVERRQFVDPGKADKYARQCAHRGHDVYLWSTHLWYTADGDDVVVVEPMEAEPGEDS